MAFGGRAFNGDVEYTPGSRRVPSFSITQIPGFDSQKWQNSFLNTESVIKRSLVAQQPISFSSLLFFTLFQLPRIDCKTFNVALAGQGSANIICDSATQPPVSTSSGDDALNDSLFLAL